MSNANQYLNQLNNTIGGFTTNVNVKVSKVNEITEAIKSNAQRTYNEITSFKQEMIENEQVQNAQENILRINQIIRERFYDYDEIRKTVMGVIMNFDMNLVRNKTVTQLSEELWITSSRYWLSYTLIAISAWACNNRNVANTAVGESYRVDKIKTSLFFCLMNLRFGRIEAAREWLCEYFNTIVPTDIQPETAILIQSYINGLFGADKQIEYTVTDVVNGWIKQIDNDEEKAEGLTQIYERYIQNINVGGTFKKDTLASHCSMVTEMEFAYHEALKYDTIIAKIESVDVENIILNAADYKARVDKILRDLVSNYDRDELELKEQQEYYNLIIENKGKEEIAERQFLAMLEQKNKKQDIGQKCVEWALFQNNDSVNVHVRKFGFQNTKSWLLEALNRWSTDFESKFVDSYPIQIEGWNCVSNGDDAEEQEMKLREHLESNKFKIKFVNAFNIVLVVAAVLGLGLGIGAAVGGWGMIPNIISWAIFGVASIILLIRCLTATRKFNRKVNYQLGVLRGCMTEIAEYRNTYFKNKEKKSVLYSKIEQL